MLCPYKVIYTQHGEHHEQYVGNKNWWLDFADKWDHTQIIEIVEMDYTDEQLARYEDVKFLPEDFYDIYSNYVADGSFPTEDELELKHPFRMIQLKKEGEQQGVELSQREINEIMHGIQLSDLEIRLLMGGL